jgi:hypothetical protein
MDQNQDPTESRPFDTIHSADVTTSKLRELLAAPPFRDQELKLDNTSETQVRRAKRKSKFSKEQDEMIIELKRKGKSWVDIAEITGVGSFLTARNRYQVLMGQQGVASTVWSAEDTRSLQGLVDQGELEKWRFISRELYKLTGKFFTDVQCRELVKDLFLNNPEEFGITEGSVQEMQIDLNRSSTKDQEKK